MTVLELRALVKNVYAATAALETGALIPAGEGVVLARLIVTKAIGNDSIDIPKV